MRRILVVAGLVFAMSGVGTAVAKPKHHHHHGHVEYIHHTHEVQVGS
jgi:DNA-binding GntR family transcriptional regulator